MRVSTAESNITNRIRLALNGLAVTFRNHTGAIEDKDGQWHRFGLCKGSSDIIGWTPVEITPEMVGQTVAVFTAIEVKTKRGRVSKEQAQFIYKLTGDGGIGFVARSDDEALALLNDAIDQLSG